MNVKYKGMLFEYCQRDGIPSPNFELVSESGVQHDKRFRVN